MNHSAHKSRRKRLLIVVATAIFLSVTGLNAQPASAANPPAIDSKPCTIVGTEGDDTLTGTSGNDVVCGLGGNDTINTLAGNDFADGGYGTDRIDGGEGADHLMGGADNDVIKGGKGNDYLRGGFGVDELFGDEGDDELHGDADNDLLDGGPGNDKVDGEYGTDGISGGDGEDAVNGGPDSDTCSPEPKGSVSNCENGSNNAKAQIQVNIKTPDGVPANVVLQGTAKFVAAKSPTGTSKSVTLTVPAGSYHVDALRTVYEGAAFAGASALAEVVARAGETTTVDVNYSTEDGATDLHATAVTQTRIDLTWSATSGTQFELRRSADETPPTTRTEGVAVAVEGNTASDGGLKEQSKYSYSLFSNVNGVWNGPLSVVTGTAAPVGSSVAAYVAPPSTLLAETGDYLNATPTGNGVRVVLAPNTPTPLIGAGFVLPVSSTLPSGYLGVVNAVSPDGRTIDLVGGGLADAFDFYDISVKELPEAIAGPAQFKAAAIPDFCKGGSAGETVKWDPSLSFGGHFNSHVDKYKFLGASVPVGASVDLEFTATLNSPMDVTFNGAFKCKVSLPKYFAPIATGPVPIYLDVRPTAEVNIGGKIDVKNAGFTATTGLKFSGELSVKNGISLSGGPILSVQPLTPTVTAVGGVGVKLGGEVTVGPGAGVADAGVNAGAFGQLNVIDAIFGPHFNLSDPRFALCFKGEAKASLAFGVQAKAYLGKWSVSEKFTPSWLNGSIPYPGTPAYWPKDCNNLQPPNKDTLLGPGVTKESDKTTGSPLQSGYVDGFVPGKKTWVLSTGRIQDALGSPSKGASFDLGLPGDAALSGAAGWPTFDAVTYTVTVVPKTSRLHVRYVFATEEFPNYVGSGFNDVMSVTVNGKNCAFVPGTTTPVAVNTINHLTNSKYFVNNLNGAAGYGTSMNGLTVPLTCTAQVPANKPATVRIAVADTSDHILDSAVALVDGGIWSD